MTQLLVQGGVILAQGPFSVGDNEIRSSDAIYPTHVIPGWRIVDVVLPDGFTCAGYTWGGNALQKLSPAPAAVDVAAFVKQVDADVDAIYAAAVGNRDPEYNQANADATAFRSAGYVGVVPPSVQSWATAKNQTAQWAADDILAAAAKLAAARDAIRANRLQRKEDAKNAATADALDAAKASWSRFVSITRSQLGI